MTKKFLEKIIFNIFKIFSKGIVKMIFFKKIFFDEILPFGLKSLNAITCINKMGENH